MGIDTSKYGYEKYQEAKNPVQSGLKKMFGFGEMESEGMISDMKKSYNKNVKNTKLGKALKETAGNAIGSVVSKSTQKL